VNNWNILVIDDEATISDNPKSRYQRYKKLESQTHSGRGFVLTFAEGVDDARRLIALRGFDLVFLDVRLKNWGDNDSASIFQELYLLAYERQTIGLVSGLWDKSAMEVVREFLVHNPKITMPLIFTFRDFENEAFAVIASQIVTHVRRQRCQYELELHPNTSIRLLHLSDLHFGSDSETRTLAGITKVPLICDKIKQCWPARSGGSAGPDIVAVTGDIGNTGHPNDYERALEWFKAFANEFSWTLPTPRILIVPGNHDFSVPLCGSHKIKLTEVNSLILSNSSEYTKKLAIYSMLPFAQFAAKISAIYDNIREFPLKAWTEFGFAEYGIVFSGFNTSKFYDENAWPIRQVDTSDINVVRDNFLNKADELNMSKLLHVNLSHHSLLRYMGAREEIVNYLECSEHVFGKSWSPQLMLHGHEHRRNGELPSGNDHMVVAAPSPTKNESSAINAAPCGLNLLELSRLSSTITSVKVRSLVRMETGWQSIDLPGKSEWKRKLLKAKK
jgi:hypothetical protein